MASLSYRPLCRSNAVFQAAVEEARFLEVVGQHLGLTFHHFVKAFLQHARNLYHGEPV